METITPPPRRCPALRHGIMHGGWRRKPVMVIQGFGICFAFLPGMVENSQN